MLLALPDTHPARLRMHIPGGEGDIFPHLDIRHLDRETFIIPVTGPEHAYEPRTTFFGAGSYPSGGGSEIGHFDVILSMVNQGLGNRI